MSMQNIKVNTLLKRICPKSCADLSKDGAQMCKIYAGGTSQRRDDSPSTVMMLSYVQNLIFDAQLQLSQCK